MLKLILAGAFLGTSAVAAFLTPEVVVAALTTLNTVMLIWHARHVRRRVEPKVDHVVEVVDQVADATPHIPWAGEERRVDVR